MKGTKYLSELVDASMFQKGALNVIKAPTGSGKTYFALNYIPSLVPNALHSVIYLIDTINGKEQIIRNYNAISDYYGWSKEINDGGLWFSDDNRVVVITYAKFGYLITKNSNFYKHFEFIICDELHSLLRFQNFSKQPNVHSQARSMLELSVIEGKTTIIALTATPDSIKKEFHAPSVELSINQDELRQYTVNQVEKYASLDTVLSKVTAENVGLCYISRIGGMQYFEEQAKNMGFSPICIWSVNNPQHPMTSEQLEVRRSILEEWVIPAQYNLLIINASSETSLKIKSHVDYVIVNSTNKDTQIQVRGRVNNDLQALYLYAEDSIPEVTVPPKYLGMTLFAREKKELVEALGLRNKNNRRYGWTTVKDILVENGYCITDGRCQNNRYVIISPSI